MDPQATSHKHEWEAIFDSINSAIWVLDEQCQIKRANKATEQLFGISAADTIGKRCWEIAHKDSLQISGCPLAKAVKSKKRESVELQVGEKWLEITVDTIPDGKDGISGFVHIITDISDRKRSEILLSESEEKYRIVSDYAYDWEYWIGPDGKFLYNSPSCERATGYSPADLRTDADLLDRVVFPDDKPKFTEHIKTHGLQNDEEVPLEFRILDKNGRIKWLEHVCQPVFSKNGSFVGQRACNRDISYRKQVENDLIASETQLRAILEASTEAVFLMDLDGNCLMANAVTAERMNIDRESLNGKNMLELLPAKVAQTRKKYLKYVSESGKPVRFEDERSGRTLLNSIYPVKSASGRVERFAIFGLDITEERSSQRAIEESRRKQSQANSMLNTVINTIPVRIFWKNLNSVYLGCNKKFAKDAGKKDPAEVIGDIDEHMAWKDQADLYTQDDLNVMTTGQPKINYEEVQTTPNGQQIWLRTTKIPLRDQDDNIIGLLGTYENITKEKELADMLRESEERYRVLFHNSHTTQLIIDPEKGRIVDASLAACQYYGYDYEVLVGKFITELHVLSSQQVHEKIAFAKSQPRCSFLFSHRLANGEIRPVEVFSGPITINRKKLLFSIVHDISDRKKAEEEREQLISELQSALVKIKNLSGMLPICCSCKKIRDDQGYWNQIEAYIRDHSEAEFTHSICPDCAKKLYPDINMD